MSNHHLVLARKYRPRQLSELIGQDALVRTLTNALSSGRVAQAYLLTGVRGTGKTSSARILARSLNCAEGPTSTPCGRCDSCLAISEDRSMDVVEADAASRTGVDDVRQLLDTTAYAPANSRYKIYIIDEIHMLSKSAFNALLKTLEEPPAHVVFVFATTEIRKVPLTVISRCQRFDLRRVDQDVLTKHFQSICEAEGVPAEQEAVKIVARAADGSVRDGLSMLEQAISTGGGRLEAEAVRSMLGLAERSRSLKVAAAALSGDPKRAIQNFRELTAAGGDPTGILTDVLEFVHLVSLLTAAPELADDPNVPAPEAKAATSLAKSLGLVQAERIWQTLAKGLQDASFSPPDQAVELALVRAAAVAQHRKAASS